MSRFLRRHSKQGDLCRATIGRFLSRSTSPSSQPPARATESSRWHSHGVHVHHVAWRLGCSERNIAPAWDYACRHEKLIAPARLKSLILRLFRRAGVVFLSRRPSNTQHSDAQGRCFFHYQAAAPTHIAQNNASGGNKKRHAEQAHKTGPVVIHRPRLVCMSARSACINARGYQARTERS